MIRISGGLPGKPNWIERLMPSAPAKVLIASGIALGLAILAGATFLIVDFRGRAVARGEHELQRMALVLADQADRTFQSLELVQTGLVREFQSSGIDTREEFAAQRDNADLRQSLRDRIAGLAHVDAVAVVDHQGKVVNHSRDWPTPATEYSDREYFKKMRTDDAPERFITEPIISRTSGMWTIYLAHRVTGANNVFLGVVLGAIKLHYFEAFYATVAETSGDTIALLRSDGSVLARYPSLVSDSGAVVMPAPSSAEHSYIARQALERYPLEVTVSRSDDALLGPWRRQAIALGMGALLVELGLIGVVVLVVRQLRSHALLAAVERARRLQDLRFAMALENLSQGLCMVDGAGQILVINPRLGDLLHMPPGQMLVGSSIRDLARACITKGSLTAADVRALERQIEALPATGDSIPSVWELADGRSLAVSLRGMPENGWLATVEDITERRRSEARIHHMAQHDPLTDLPNRTLFAERLKLAVNRARDGESCALLCLDLDHFKQVNDALGHGVGDALLRAAAARLQHAVRGGDTVARLGGDEFAVLQVGVNQPAEAEALASRLVAALGDAYELEGHNIIVRTSIGIAILVKGHLDDETSVLRKADFALYQAKSDGRSRHCLFTQAMETAMHANRQLEIDLS